MEASYGTEKKQLWERIEGINETEGREKIEKKSILEWKQTGHWNTMVRETSLKWSQVDK